MSAFATRPGSGKSAMDLTAPSDFRRVQGDQDRQKGKEEKGNLLFQEARQGASLVRRFR